MKPQKIKFYRQKAPKTRIREQLKALERKRYIDSKFIIPNLATSFPQRENNLLLFITAPTSSLLLSHLPQGLSSKISLSSSESSPLSRGDLCSGSLLERLSDIPENQLKGTIYVLKTDVTLFINTDTSCQTLHTTIHSHGSLFTNTKHTSRK